MHAVISAHDALLKGSNLFQSVVFFTLPFLGLHKGNIFFYETEEEKSPSF
jgi:hypothetical protein